MGNSATMDEASNLQDVEKGVLEIERDGSTVPSGSGEQAKKTSNPPPEDQDIPTQPPEGNARSSTTTLQLINC